MSFGDVFFPKNLLSFARTIIPFPGLSLSFFFGKEINFARAVNGAASNEVIRNLRRSMIVSFWFDFFFDYRILPSVVSVQLLNIADSG